MIELNVSFRDLAESDLDLMVKWLNAEHVRAFYQRDKISLDQVRAKYLPRISRQESARCHLALLDGRPFGFVQCYRVKDYQDYAVAINFSDGISIDFFIGEVSQLGLGLGRQMLKNYLKIAFSAFPDEDKCFICHDKRNSAALNCSKAADFSYIKDVVEDGALSSLFAARR